MISICGQSTRRGLDLARQMAEMLVGWVNTQQDDLCPMRSSGEDIDVVTGG